MYLIHQLPSAVCSASFRTGFARLPIGPEPRWLRRARVPVARGYVAYVASVGPGAFRPERPPPPVVSCVVGPPAAAGGAFGCRRCSPEPRRLPFVHRTVGGWAAGSLPFPGLRRRPLLAQYSSPVTGCRTRLGEARARLAGDLVSRRTEGKAWHSLFPGAFGPLPKLPRQ